MEFLCNATKKMSKNGNTYTCLEIVFPNGYKKIVFLDTAETYMVNEFIEED